MGDLNQRNFVRDNISIARGPVLEVGSRDYGNTPDMRPFFPGCRYVGVDMSCGKNVDVVADLAADMDEVRRKIGSDVFGTVLCLSVLEHCANPFALCGNLVQLLGPGGVIFVSVPFSWRIHGYPSDYWRFTPDGVRALFPALDFDAHPGNVTTSVIGQACPIDNYMMRAELDTKKALGLKRYGRFTAWVVGFCRRRNILPFIFRYPYLFPPVMINMIGVKR